MENFLSLYLRKTTSHFSFVLKMDLFALLAMSHWSGCCRRALLAFASADLILFSPIVVLAAIWAG